MIAGDPLAFDMKDIVIRYPERIEARPYRVNLAKPRESLLEILLSSGSQTERVLVPCTFANDADLVPFYAGFAPGLRDVVLKRRSVDMENHGVCVFSELFYTNDFVRDGCLRSLITPEEEPITDYQAHVKELSNAPGYRE